MRISDWSSDLCSSDLFREIGGRGHAPMGKKRRDRGVPVIGIGGIEGGNIEGRKEFSVGRRARRGMGMEIEVAGYRLEALGRNTRKLRSDIAGSLFVVAARGGTNDLKAFDRPAKAVAQTAEQKPNPGEPEDS